MLRELAYGLRQAGGVLNPDVQKQTFTEDANIEAASKRTADQDALMRKRFELEQSTPEAQMRREELENRRAFQKAVVDSGGDMGKIAGAAIQFGKPEVAMNIYNQQEARAQRAQAAAQAHEARMAEIERRKEEGLAKLTDARQRAEFEQSFKLQSLALQKQGAAASLELRKEMFELKKLQLLTSAAGGKDGMSAESAGKVAMADQAILDIRGTTGLIFDKDGNLKRDVIAAMNAPGTAGLPFNEEARRAYSMMYNAAEAKLRIETGAAATEREIKSILNRFLPRITDTPKTASEKLERLEAFMSSTIGQTKGVRKDLLKSQTPAAQPASPQGWAIKPL